MSRLTTIEKSWGADHAAKFLIWVKEFIRDECGSQDADFQDDIHKILLKNDIKNIYNLSANKIPFQLWMDKDGVRHNVTAGKSSMLDLMVNHAKTLVTATPGMSSTGMMGISGTLPGFAGVSASYSSTELIKEMDEEVRQRKREALTTAYADAKGGGATEKTFDKVHKSGRINIETMESIAKSQKHRQFLYVETGNFTMEDTVKFEGEKEDARLLQWGARCTAGGHAGKKVKDRGIASAIQARLAWVVYLRAEGTIEEVDVYNYFLFIMHLAVKEGLPIAFTYDVLRREQIAAESQYKNDKKFVEIFRKTSDADGIFFVDPDLLREARARSKPGLPVTVTKDSPFGRKDHRGRSKSVDKTRADSRSRSRPKNRHNPKTTVVKSPQDKFRGKVLQKCITTKTCVHANGADAQAKSCTRPSCNFAHNCCWCASKVPDICKGGMVCSKAEGKP